MRCRHLFEGVLVRLHADDASHLVRIAVVRVEEELRETVDFILGELDTSRPVLAYDELRAISKSGGPAPNQHIPTVSIESVPVSTVKGLYQLPIIGQGLRSLIALSSDTSFSLGYPLMVGIWSLIRVEVVVVEATEEAPSSDIVVSSRHNSHISCIHVLSVPQAMSHLRWFAAIRGIVKTGLSTYKGNSVVYSSC